MASSSTPPRSGGGAPNSQKTLGLMEILMKQKNSFIQFFGMTSILLLSMRSVVQKHRIHGLQEETYDLKEENDSLTNRMEDVKRSLLHEASLDSTGLFASRLRLLFDQHH